MINTRGTSTGVQVCILEGLFTGALKMAAEVLMMFWCERNRQEVPRTNPQHHVERRVGASVMSAADEGNVPPLTNVDLPTKVIVGY